MACNCMNEDGTPSQVCYGICHHRKTIESDAVRQRSDKSLEDRMEYIMGAFITKVNQQIDKLLNICEAKYREGYRDGFNDGQH